MVCRPALVASYVSFGVHAAASGVADFVGKNAPTVLVGGLLGVLAAGQYSMAFQLTRLLDSLISGPIYIVIFTAIAQLGERRAQAAQVAMRGLRGVAIVLAPAFAGLAAVADLLVKLLLGPKWAGSAAVLALLAPFGFLLCLLSIVGAALMGLGRSQAQFRLTVLSGVASCLGGLAGAPFGLKGVAAGLSLGAVAVTPVYFQALARELRMRLAAMAAELAPPVVAALAMLGVVFALRAASREASEWAQLILAVGGGLLSFTGILALMYGRRLLSDVRSILPGSVLSEPNPS
jgi:PST family polysaccharide transporter